MTSRWSWIFPVLLLLPLGCGSTSPVVLPATPCEVGPAPEFPFVEPVVNELVCYSPEHSDALWRYFKAVDRYAERVRACNGQG